MTPQTIDEMLEALAPALRSKRKARELLQNYWSDKIALLWTVEDVYRAARENEITLSGSQAHQILEDLIKHHNPRYGLQWRDVVALARQFGKQQRPMKRTRA